MYSELWQKGVFSVKLFDFYMCLETGGRIFASSPTWICIIYYRCQKVKCIFKKWKIDVLYSFFFSICILCDIPPLDDRPCWKTSLLDGLPYWKTPLPRRFLKLFSSHVMRYIKSKKGKKRPSAGRIEVPLLRRSAVLKHTSSRMWCRIKISIL